MDYKINVGDFIPKFTAKDQEGETIQNDDLIGGPVVLYFYPKDDTPGCTKEACSFRDNMEKIEEMDVLVIGVSPDGQQSHQKFIQKHNLNFTLLSDENRELAKKFDVLRTVKDPNGQTVQKIERTTFVIDPNGEIRWIERPVSVEGHVDRVIAAIHEHVP